MNFRKRRRRRYRGLGCDCVGQHVTRSDFDPADFVRSTGNFACHWGQHWTHIGGQSSSRYTPGVAHSGWIGGRLALSDCSMISAGRAPQIRSDRAGGALRRAIKSASAPGALAIALAHGSINGNDRCAILLNLLGTQSRRCEGDHVDRGLNPPPLIEPG
jgi:hypothetical protein